MRGPSPALRVNEEIRLVLRGLRTHNPSEGTWTFHGSLRGDSPVLSVREGT